MTHNLNVRLCLKYKLVELLPQILKFFGAHVLWSDALPDADLICILLKNYEVWNQTQNIYNMTR